jgi:hypothetical protein
LHVTAGNYDTERLIEVLSVLRKFLGGEKATLLWDGLPSHHSAAMRAWIRTQRSWLVVERLPRLHPSSPGRGRWSSRKAVEVANLTTPTLGRVIDRATGASAGSAARSAARSTWPHRSWVTLASRFHHMSTGTPSPIRWLL